jgi:hypothetical protein
MKTKTLLSATAILILLIAFSTTANLYADVELQGRFDTGVLRSLSEDFIVNVDANVINIDYWKNNKNITIEITDAIGQSVYNKVVNPVSGESLTIDISDWEKGSYHISFTNTSGGCIYGDFVIE